MKTQIIKSPNDNSTYKHLVLENKLEVVLVYDPNLDISGVSLTVRVGSYDNPPEYLGLAHFLEHMLFMGTKKYPEVNYFHEFTNKHGGSRNAHTADEFTSYYYDIISGNLLESLDIFGHFFINPLFNKNTVDKELEAVDSEHSKNITIEEIRVDRLMNIFSNKDYYSYKFSTGNLETLKKPELRTNLIKFYKENYSADIMKLSIVTNIELDTLEKIVREIFSKIENRNKSSKSYKTTNTTITSTSNNISSLLVKNKNNKNLVVKAIPIVDENILTIYWEFPSLINYFVSKPLNYIMNLIGHESYGSILYNLRKLKLATQLSCNICFFDTNFSILCLKIVLTDEGFNSISTILDLVYSYITILVADKRLYKEFKYIADIEFKFLQKDSAINRALKITEGLIYYKYKYVLCLNYKYPKYSDRVSHLINRFIKYLNNDNSLIIIRSKKYNKIINLEVEKYYNIKYILSEKNYNINIVKSDNIHLPKKNIYLPVKSDLVITKVTSSAIAKNTNTSSSTSTNSTSSNLDIWSINTGQKYNDPKILCSIYLFNNKISHNLENYCKITLYNKLYIRIINPILYYIIEAGSSFNLIGNPEYICFNITTYNSSLHKILKHLVDIYINLKDYVTKDIFTQIKSELLHQFKNYIYKPPYILVKNYLTDSIIHNSFTYLEGYNMIKKFTSINTSIRSVFNEILLESGKFSGFIGGNLNSSNMSSIFTIFAKLIDKNFVFVDNIYLKDIKKFEFSRELYNPEESNSAILIAVSTDISKNDHKKICLLKLVESILEDTFFSQLRSIDQSGYIVHSNMATLGSVRNPIYSINFTIQTYKSKLDDIETKIISFIDKVKIEKDVLQEHKDTLITLLNKKNENMYEEFSVYIDELVEQSFDFDIKKKYVDIVKDIDLNDIVEFYDRYFTGKDKVIYRVKMYSQIK